MISMNSVLTTHTLCNSFKTEMMMKMKMKMPGEIHQEGMDEYTKPQIHSYSWKMKMPGEIHRAAMVEYMKPQNQSLQELAGYSWN